MHNLDQLSTEEKTPYLELKRRVFEDLTPELKNDPYLFLRFLRARDFDLDQAEDMLRNHIAWRIANQIDNIHNYIPNEVVIKYLPLSRIGFDKEGAVVRYFAFGNTDTKGILKSCKQNACIKTVVSMFESDAQLMKKQSEKLGKNIQQWVYVLNFAKYNFAKATHKQTLDALIQLFRTYEANYPERLKTAYIINASVYFTLMFAVIKPLLSGNTIRKVIIYGKDGWKEDLRKAIDPKVLPRFLGGEKTDPDGNPDCRTYIKHGSLVPDELYMTRSTERLKNKAGVKKISVSRMSKTNLDFDVLEKGSTLEWEFETECKDIGFGLFYKKSADNKAELVELIPKQRMDTHLTAEAGMFLCDKPGKYVMTFDNSYSWIYPKEIYCKAEVIKPETKKIKTPL